MSIYTKHLINWLHFIRYERELAVHLGDPDRIPIPEKNISAFKFFVRAFRSVIEATLGDECTVLFPTAH